MPNYLSFDFNPDRTDTAMIRGERKSITVTFAILMDADADKSLVELLVTSCDSLAQGYERKIWAGRTTRAFITGGAAFPSAELARSKVFSSPDTLIWPTCENSFIRANEASGIMSEYVTKPRKEFSAGDTRACALVHLHEQYLGSRDRSSFRFNGIAVGPSLIQLEDGTWQADFVWSTRSRGSSQPPSAGAEKFVIGRMREWRDDVKNSDVNKRYIRARDRPEKYNFNGETGPEIRKQISEALDKLLMQMTQSFGVSEQSLAHSHLFLAGPELRTAERQRKEDGTDAVRGETQVANFTRLVEGSKEIDVVHYGKEPNDEGKWIPYTTPYTLEAPTTAED